jgi:hypothetical protein
MTGICVLVSWMKFIDCHRQRIQAMMSFKLLILSEPATIGPGGHIYPLM